MSRLSNYVIDAVRRPREQLSRGQHFVRHSWELTAHCWRQLHRHRAAGMAAELTYRTIFSLIPVVVLGLVMFRVVGGLDEVQSKVENQLYSFFGVPEILPEAYTRAEAAVEAPADQPPDAVEMDAAIAAFDPDSADDTADGAVEDPIDTRLQADASIRRTLREVTAKVASLDFKSIGVIGLLLFIYAAVSLANSTEHVFNRIYDAPSERPVHIRLAIHWSIITLGSGLLAMSLYMSGQVIEWFAEISDGSTSRLVLNHIVSIGASWILLFLLYALMPNTHVSVRSAVIGSLVGSLLWEGAKYGFQIYVSKAVPYSAIYGSLGLLPLFLFWVYLTWLIVLFGLILTYTLQTLRGRSLGQFDSHEDTLFSGDPDWMLPIMSEVGHAFDCGKPIDNQELADRLGLPGRIVHDMTGKLIDAAMLRRVTAGAGEDSSLTLARPADKINIADILDLAHRVRPTSDHPAWRTLANLKQAERAAADGKTLADVKGW